MIRVNLLGEAKKRKRSAAPTITLAPAGGSMILGLLLGAIVLAAAVQWYRHSQLVARGVELDKQISELTREKAELAQVQSQYETFSKRKELLTARINVIEQLKAQQAGPVLLLTAVANSVSAQDTLWLTAMDKKAEKLTMSGTALSMKAVADLMTRLQSTKQFKSVDLKETSQETGQSDVDTFKFALDLVVDVPVPAGAAAATPAPAPAAAGRRARAPKA